MANGPNLPMPISYVGSKYLLFDIEAITWLRKEHHICGVMGGTLPQSPSQNIFLGLPVQIMPEEAQLLVEKGVGYIYDEAVAHEQALQDSDTSRQGTYLAQIRKKGEQVSVAREEEKKAIKQLKQGKTKSKAESATEEGLTRDSREQSEPQQQPKDEAETSLFDSGTAIKPNEATTTTSSIVPHNIVPTTSTFWLQLPPSSQSGSESMSLLPNVPSSYHLYKHLNSRGFFMTPGLRFGCQYCVYPGDPLRFHSHFLAVAKDWDEEINLMDIIGGGRLGTGVKKGYLIGGLEPPRDRDVKQEGKVRTFSVEWAVM